jgi:hypothetical protein
LKIKVKLSQSQQVNKTDLSRCVKKNRAKYCLLTEVTKRSYKFFISIGKNFQLRAEKKFIGNGHCHKR